MSKSSRLLCLVLLTTILTPVTWASTSGDSDPPRFSYSRGSWYDSFGLTRDYAEGNDGYIPGLFSETIGPNAERAYSLGLDFSDKYYDSNTKADAILSYVQRWTEYGYDEDNVVMGGTRQEEWAWNADEMTHSMDAARGIEAIGDCEDMAFLCQTIYHAAGFETAIVDAPQHVALLIWLPEYPNADMYWDLLNDDRGAGWIWIEATGSDNPVGWTPSDFFDGDWSVYIYSDGQYMQYEPQKNVDTVDEYPIDWDLVLFVIILLILILSKTRR